MEHQRPKVNAVDLVAKHLVHLWQATNAARYRSAGVEPDDIRPNLRMVFRDYVQEVREDNPEEAERFRRALAPELDF
jgi:hypothetical protein